MANTLYRTGISYTIPATPYQPARPGYWASYYETERQPIYEWRWVLATTPETSQTGIRHDSQMVYMRLIVGYQNVTVLKTRYVPATPEVLGTPPRVVENPPRGWTAFARSVGDVPGEGSATWKVLPGTNGAAVGLAPWAEPVSGYGHITHGLLFLDGYVRLLRTGAVLGTFADGDEFSQAVADGDVVFSQNGGEIATETAVYPGSTPLHLHAALYSVGDGVDDPVLASSAPPLANEGSGSLSAPQFAVAGGDVRVSQGMIAAPQFAVSGYGGTVEADPISYGAVMPPQFAVAGLSVVTHMGEGDFVAPQFVALGSDDPYGEGHLIAPQFEVMGWEWTAGQAYALDAFLLDVPLLPFARTRIDARDAFTFDVLMTAEQSTTVDARDAFSFDVAMSAVADRVVDARDVFWFDVPMLVTDEEGDCWAVNLDGFGSTTYSGYPFNSFANIGGRYFGASATGIHELEGDTDAGAPIRASVDFGVRDFGASLKKTVSEVYLGMSSTGHLFIKILAEGREYVYRTRSYSEHPKQQRVTLGKGLKPNYAGLQLFNDDGADFALDSVEFVPVTMSRRI